METMQPILIRGRDEWDQINMPKAEFQERVDKIKKEMQKEGIDVLFVYGKGPNQYGDFCYVSNCVPKMPGSGALIAIPQKGEVTLIVATPLRDVPATERITWVENVRPSFRISAECIKYLEEKNFMTATIGFADLQLMPYSQWRVIREGTKQCKVVDADHIIAGMRMVKSQKEGDQIRRSSRILSQIFDSIPDTLFQNMNEMILKAIVDREARLEGAEDFRILVAQPRGGKWALRPVKDVKILPGNSVIIYLAVSFERCWSEGIRTFVAKPSSLTKPASENAEALYERISGMLKPGKTASQFYKEAIDELQKSKVDYILDYGLGQGIGLDLQEAPVLTGEDATMLKENMCLTLRLAIKDTDLGAIMLGDTIQLSKDGPEVLTR